MPGLWPTAWRYQTAGPAAVPIWAYSSALRRIRAHFEGLSGPLQRCQAARRTRLSSAGAGNHLAGRSWIALP